MTAVVVDTSALVAVTFSEPAGEAVSQVLTLQDRRHLSSATVVELGIVLSSRTSGNLTASEVIGAARLTVEPFETSDALLAIEAWNRFGKGRHRAPLNLGDCYSYALARRLGVPLVAVGDDFRQTDLIVLP